MKEFFEDELQNYDGKNGKPAYIAYKGKVYDVSKSFLWRRGKHQVLHDAGKDLTEELSHAPHGEGMLERVPVIGMLKKRDGTKTAPS